MRNDKNILETRVVRGYMINVFTDPKPVKPDENMYLGGEVLAFEIIDVNGRILENLYGVCGSVEDVMKKAEACIPTYETPVKTEVYMWRVLGSNPSDSRYSLDCPWESGIDSDFASAEEAEADREKYYPHRELWLCKVTTTPLELYRAKKEA